MPKLRFLFALVPSNCDRWHVAARAVRVASAHGGWRDFRMRRRPAGFDGERMTKLKSPEGEVVPVAAQIAHGAAAEIPPAIPFRSGKIDVVKRALGCRTEPQIPMQR